MHGYEAASDDLCSAGLVDRHRVGIMGHSRAGWNVEYALAFSSFPFDAAIVDDNIDSGYFEAGFAGWTDEQMCNGAKPFGQGMKRWLASSPALSVQNVRFPVLMLIYVSFAG